jgi:hypothetical protein
MTPTPQGTVPFPADIEEAQLRALTARCPECDYREGPFDNPMVASDRLMRHINKQHAALISYLRAKPLPSRNESFARTTAVRAIQQAQKLDLLAKPPSLIVGADGVRPPVDVTAELLTFIRNTNKAVACMLDVLLEMRTGQQALEWAPPGGEQPPSTDAPAGEVPQEDQPPAATDAPAPTEG